MLNNVVLIGRISKDLEVRKTGTGKSVLSFSIAVPRAFNRDQVDFINCVAWDKTADFMSTYLNKGNLISVEGWIQTGSYDNTEGKKVYTTDVVANRVQGLESKASREGSGNTQNMYKEDKPLLDIVADDLPF